MNSTRSQDGSGRGFILVAALAALLAGGPAAAESKVVDFSAATGDGSIITKDGIGGYDASMMVDSVDIGKEASTSGTGGGGGSGAAGRRDDGSGCSCSVERGAGDLALPVGLVALFLLYRGGGPRRMRRPVKPAPR